ncbi:MAG: TlpA disulfide reductase family protein [Chloroflexi bacterium]|nr:TlpA disulfide reductase family protein [Chloroflexota bacterium]MDA1002563.1 TlpA disulfide reductase family protein [Chloroflexota bacterium]
MRETLRHRLLRYAIVLAIVAVVGGIFVRREYLADGGASAETTPIEVGRAAPDFELETRDGNVRLSDFRGRAVIVNFWATWCAPCRREMPDLQAAYEGHAAAGDLVVLAVNVTSADSRSAAEAFVDEFGLTFPIAFDVSGEVTQRYGVLGLPASFFVDGDGILRARTYGPLSAELLTDGLAAAGLR